jgi:hypothetical protein
MFATRSTECVVAGALLAAAAGCGGSDGTAPQTGTHPVPVASVIVTPAAASMFVGSIQFFGAETRSATGELLTQRGISWSTSDTSKAKVAANGLVTALSTGNLTLTATSEGVSGTAAITVKPLLPGMVVTSFGDPVDFISHCPQGDTAFARIRADFEYRSDGVVSTVSPVCTEPYATTPRSTMTDELLALQTLRLALYMNRGTAGKLPWTTLGIYDWMKSQIAGINFHAAATNSECCDVFNGKKYLIIARKDSTSLGTYRTLDGLFGWLALFAHETRHVAGPSHVTGCAAFPAPTDPVGCDATYDLTNLGSYGVQYWLYSNWVTGTFAFGLGCSSTDVASKYLTSFAQTANLYPARIVKNSPPSVSIASPLGGYCFP